MACRFESLRWRLSRWIAPAGEDPIITDLRERLTELVVDYAQLCQRHELAKLHPTHLAAATWKDAARRYRQESLVWRAMWRGEAADHEATLEAIGRWYEDQQSRQGDPPFLRGAARELAELVNREQDQPRGDGR